MLTFEINTPKLYACIKKTYHETESKRMEIPENLGLQLLLIVLLQLVSLPNQNVLQINKLLIIWAANKQTKAAIPSPYASLFGI